MDIVVGVIYDGDALLWLSDVTFVQTSLIEKNSVPYEIPTQ